MGNLFLSATDIAEQFNIKKPCANEIIQNLNVELKTQGFYYFPNKISRDYFLEKLEGGEIKCQ